MKNVRWYDLLAKIINNKNSQQASADKKQKLTNKQRKLKMHFLGNNFKGIYLTQREAECILQLLQGK